MVVVVRILLLGCVLAGCVQSGVVHCADGRTCPAGTICAEPGLCALPVQLTVCEGQAEGTPCSFPGGTGACLGGVCIPTGCGNGIREPGEACDDGNTASGDGCSSDCQSNELCGDLEPNPFLGEECDDGNRLDHDGCSSSCLREVASWSRHDHGPPAARRGAAIAYDSIRKRVVLFGGVGPANARYDDTWEWDGTAWSRQDPLVSPPARFGGAMAFDPTTGRIVLFGGLGGSALADTWEYLGSTWRKVLTSTTPPARHGHALAYDGTRRQVVLVGGTNTLERFDDVYGWTGVDWAPLPALPRPRAEHAMAYDPVRGQLIVFSGRESTTAAAVDDAWALDATGWTQLPASGAPRASAGAAFDAINGRVLIYGGTSDGVTTSAEATLTAWDGATWSTLALAGAPSPRLAMAATYDLAAGAFLVFGGYLQDFSYDNTTHTLGASWQFRPPPAAITQPDLVASWDPDRGVGLMLGAVSTEARMFRWRNGITALAPTGPTARTRAAIGWDGGTTIVAGGSVAGRGAIQPTDTWSFSTSWLLRRDGAPFPRTRAAMAPSTTGLVLFGGTQGGVFSAETWRWDGSDWSLAPVAGPAARNDHAMAFDPVRGRTVLNGGRREGALELDHETWEWDGATWSMLPGATQAPRRAGHDLVYDPQRRRIVSYVQDAGSAELLELDPVAGVWSLVQPTNVGPAITNANPAAFYDPTLHGLVVLGNMMSSSTEAWLLRYRSAGSEEQCGSLLDADQDGLVGCADPDCWYVCTPHCPPGTLEAGTCDLTRPRCGDGTCGAVEDCRSCPDDCGACTPLCGDAICDAPGETTATCPGDC